MMNRDTLNHRTPHRRWRGGLAAVAFAGLLGGANAQTANMYSFASAGGGSLRDMTGSTMLVPTGSYASAVTGIGFNFVYEGTTYTQFSANNYGSLRLGGSVIQSFQVQNLTGNQPLISPLSVDGDETANWAEYIVTGSAPNRVLTVHWDHHAYSWDGGTHYIFQASLFEGTGQIEFNYGTGGTMSWWSNFAAITGSNPANFLNIRPGDVASSVDATSLNAWPGNGKVYTFSPPAACTTPAPGDTQASPSSGCPGITSTLTLQNSTPGGGVSYQWQSSPDGNAPWTNIGANTPTHTASGVMTTTWFRCAVTCSTGPSTVNSNPVQVTISAPTPTYFTYSGTQYTEDFSTWQNLCSSFDVPDTYWTGVPSYGPGTWRSSTTTPGESGWNNTSGGFFAYNAGATSPTARFHSRQGGSVVGTLDFHLDLSAGTGGELLRFEYINSAGNGTLEILVSNNGGGSFTSLGTLGASNAPPGDINTWYTKEYTIGSTSAQTVIRLKGTAGAPASGNDIGVDNFRIIPAITCTKPTALAATVNAPNAADISWTCSGCTGSYYVEYGTTGFTQGTGTVVGPVAGSPATLSGLPNGSYQAYVWQDCGGNGLSEVAGPVAFSIVAGDLCGNAINLASLGLPVMSDMFTTIGNTSGANLNYPTSACFATLTGRDIVLYQDVEAGGTFTIGPWCSSYNVSIAFGGSCPGNTCLASHDAGSGNGYLAAGPNVIPYGPWDDNILSWTNNTCNTERVYVLATHTGVGGLFQAEYYSYTPPGGPICAVVTGQVVNTVNTGTSAGVSWNATCSGNVIVEYGPAGFTPGIDGNAGGGTVVAVNGTSTTLTGLSLDVDYEVYVRNDCGSGLYSGNGTAVPFTLIHGDDCSRTIDLSLETSPFSGSTTGTHNDITNHPCGSYAGGDLAFFHTVEPGATISFFAAHDYPAGVSVLYGATCPGSTVLTCAADLDTYTWLNTTGVAQDVYWIQDGSGTGDFTLEWVIEPPCVLGLPGSPCDAGPLYGSGIVTESCTCEGQDPLPCTNFMYLEFQNDDHANEVSWEILSAGNMVLMTGANAIPNNQIGTQEICLPDGCYRLRILDSGGDGMTTGGYELRIQGSNDRIIDNTNNFSSGSESTISGNQTFCLPLGVDKVIHSSCDKLDWVNNKFIVCHANAAVTAQYGVSNATSGYEFWFFDPNGSYSFRRFRSHSTSDGYGSGATRACHFKVNGWVHSMATPHLPANTLLNVRVRGRVANSNLEFGPACQFRIDAALAACPRISLQDDPANVSDFSCGVNREFGGASRPANRIHAKPPQPVPVVPSANVRYQFRFRIAGEGVCIVRPPQTSARMVLNWTTGEQLVCSKTYEVDVRVSLDGGATWCFGPGATDQASACADTEDWGKVCLVTITCDNLEVDGGGNSMSLQGDGDFTMYPNPNNGDQLFVSLSRVQDGVQTVSVDIFDLTGKRVSTRIIAVQDGSVKVSVDLNRELAGGLYMVNITAGDKTYTERLVIQR
ncbi:MAG: T9SS type A sorting domain-containing protein [Flavobacteriales bacterium]|nr:T9SS type A sorting domain-containing protein [Flavobacteriales bacterium]